MPKSPEATLRAFVARHETQREAAKALRISSPYLHDLLHGRRNFSATILAKLGLEPVTTFRKKRTA